MTQKKIDLLAKEFVEIELQRKTLENRASEIKALLRKECPGQSFMFEDLGMKVSVGEQVVETGINAPVLFDAFIAENRIEDLKNIISITKTAITKNLTDSSEIIEKYGVEVGLKEGAVKLSPFSKKDLKALQD